jgi:3-deoxy-D-manno-octulosonic-acid transferase
MRWIAFSSRRRPWLRKVADHILAGLIYNLFLAILLPFAFIYYLWRIFVARKSDQSWRENLGALPKLAANHPGRQVVWIHAASVGETVASLPVQDELRRILPDAVILVTTITQTGNAMALKAAKSADAVAYFPVDYPLPVSRALNRVRPDVFVMVEGEIWPNFIWSMKRRGIPMILVNGRVSDRNFKQSRRWRWLMSWTISKIDRFCMQTEVDAERICALGAAPDAISVCGSTKFDQAEAQLDEAAATVLRADLGIPAGAPVFVAGSTNPGEDRPVLEAFVQMRKSIAYMRLVIAPRQLERAEEIRTMAESLGLICAQRSKKGSSPTNFEVLILDSFGELASVYAVGAVSFVGGTLIRKGGHSLIQPILQGKPVFFGPHTFKTRDVAGIAMSTGVGFEVRDAGELAARAADLLLNPGRLAEIDAACRRLVSENQGASARCAAAIAELLACRRKLS